MDTLIVMKEETVSSVSGDLESYVPSMQSFIVEDYSEDVVCESPSSGFDTSTNELGIAQEVFIDHDQVTYEVRAIEDVIGMDSSVEDTSMEEIDNPFETGEVGIPDGILYYKDIESIKRPPVKKRRGRPPKFEVSEIGMDGKKWYACTVCEARYEDRMELMQHMRQHNPDRPFHCKCGKAFKQAAHLKVHERQHTGEKPFECTICGKGFRQKAIVDQHMRTHTQLRPYACTYANCDKSFAQKTSLDNHIKSHQSGRLSEAFKKQQEEQKRKSILAQEALKTKNQRPKIVHLLQNNIKKINPVNQKLTTISNGDKVKTTVVKMTQAQFEQYLQSRATNHSGIKMDTNTKTSVPTTSNIPQKTTPNEMTTKQKAATGPFLAYVNMCKPVLQSERPELSLLEVLKELASKWNSMSKDDKQKYASMAQEPELKNKLKTTLVSKSMPEVIEEHEEIDATNSIEGAVFEIGDTAESITQVDQQLSENIYQIKQDKSLNQNVFGKKAVLLSKDGRKVHLNTHLLADPSMNQQPMDQGVIQFEESNEKNSESFESNTSSAIVYGSELELGNAIFYLPNIEDGSLEKVLE